MKKFVDNFVIMKDYKKLYEDANKRVATRFGSDVARELFPEFYESDDEKIRKHLLNWFKNCNWTAIDNETLQRDDIIAWLEKQGEKLPVGFYYVNSEGKKFYSDTFKYGDFTFHVENQDEQKTNKYEGYCKGCNNVKGCVTCVDGDQWAHYKEVEQKPTDKIESISYDYITPNRQFFQWIYDRLVHVHNENPNVDYMLSLKERIENMQKSSWSKEDEERLQSCLNILQAKGIMGVTDTINTTWLKSIKDRI